MSAHAETKVEDYGLYAEYPSPESLMGAIKHMRDLGYEKMDAYTPYPIHGLDEAMGIPKTIVPWLILAGGLCGASGAYFLQWYLNAVNYPIVVGGRPPHAFPAFLIVTFEMGVLFAGLTAITSAIVLGGLPRLWHPAFEVPGFERHSIDRFWLQIESDDPKYGTEATRAHLQETTPLQIAVPEVPHE